MLNDGRGVAGARLESYGLSDKGCVRTNNEDCFLLRPDLGLYVLADGMGGARAGETASRMAVDAVAASVEAAARRDSQVLLAAVEEANRRVLAASGLDPSLEGMGTTLVAVLETGDEVAVASVGDSRVYLLDDTGFRAVTEDQTWINDVGRPLGLDEESLRRHPMRHVLTMAIGAGSPLSINYYAVRLKPGAMLLMSSDGLHGVVDQGSVEGLLRGAADRPLESPCRQLIEAARRSGGPDNITAILLRRR